MHNRWWALIAGCSIAISACTDIEQANAPSNGPSTSSPVMTTIGSTSSAAPYAPTAMVLEPALPVSAVDTMWSAWLWKVERADGRIVVSATHSTDFEQRETVSLTFADAPSPLLLNASSTVSDAMAESERNAAIAASDVHLARFDPSGVIAGVFRSALGRQLRFWVDLGTPFTMTGIGNHESPVTMDLTDHVIFQWHELSVQLLRVDGCDTGDPSTAIYLHGLEGPWGSPGERDQVLRSGAPTVQATIGNPNHSYTYDLEVQVECSNPPSVRLTAGVADWTPR